MVLFAIESPKSSGPNTVARELAILLADSSVIEVRKIYELKELLAAILGIFRYKAFHFYSQTTPALLLMFLFFLLRKPVIYTVHGDLQRELQTKQGLKRMLWIPIHKLIFGIARVITFPTVFNRDVNVEFLQGKDCRVIPNMYNFTDFPLDSALAEGFNSQKLVLITSFNHKAKQEGVHTLARVLQLLPKDITLDIFGGGKNLNEFLSFYAKEPRIKFLGHVPNASKYLKSYALMPYISYQDNMPMVIFEVVNAGIPVISLPTGGIPEMLPREAIITDNDEKIAEAILTILQDTKKHQSLYKMEYELIVKKFASEELKKKILNLYTSFL